MKHQKKRAWYKLQSLIVQLKEFDTKIKSIESSLKQMLNNFLKSLMKQIELQTQSKVILDVSDLNILKKEITNKFNTINEKYNSLSKRFSKSKFKKWITKYSNNELNQKQINDNTKLEETKQNFNNALIENSFSSKKSLKKHFLKKSKEKSYL